MDVGKGRECKGLKQGLSIFVWNKSLRYRSKRFIFFFSDTTTLPGVRTSVKREERSIDTKEGEDGGVLYLSRDSQLLQGSRVRVGQWGLKV